MSTQREKVHWLGAAQDKVNADLKPRLAHELNKVFSSRKVHRITVHDCMMGYNPDQNRKIILAVEVQTEDSYRLHIVKLGEAGEVESDWKGWHRCAAGRSIGSRIFVPVTGQILPRGRAAAIYEDAYTFFGPDPKTQRPESLEDVLRWAVTDDKPDAASVERVLSQIFGDLERWFYSARSRPDDKVAKRFYKKRLDRGLRKWEQDAGRKSSTLAASPVAENWRLTLRRDAIWLFCGRDAPVSEKPAAYLDPCDFIRWSMDTGNIPSTLVGCSHGDLHGRNIFVGVRRGEAEFPVVIDYGLMDNKNVLAWDFARLETGVKTKLVPVLFKDPAARQAVLSRRSATTKGGLVFEEPPDEKTSLGGESMPGGLGNMVVTLLSTEQRETVVARARRAARLAFAFEIEQLLAEATRRIEGRQDAESRAPPGKEPLFAHDPKVDKLLRIVVRIRQEAGLALGFEPEGRHLLWRDEYYFALAAYGLATAKWSNYEKYWTEVVLVSAGVAVAQMDLARAVISKRLAQAPRRGERQPTYRIPLFHAHKQWKSRDLEGARNILDKASADFAHAVPLQQEHGLILAAQGKPDEARNVLFQLWCGAEGAAQLEPLVYLCCVFGDYETLSRLGRVLKDYGDQGRQSNGYAFTDLAKPPAVQYYQVALTLYEAAFWISGDYFPGVNAMTLALLSGNPEASRELANKVLTICANKHLDLFASDTDRFYIFASEGEAALVSAAQAQDAASWIERAQQYYDAALQVVGTKQMGVVQSTWNQLCRLWQKLGGDIVDPVANVFEAHKETWNLLQPGPMGNCGRVRS